MKSRRKIGAWLVVVLLAAVAGAGSLASPAFAWGYSYDTVISGVKVHMAFPEQALSAGNSWTMGPSILHLTDGSGGHLYMTNKHTGAVIWSAGDYPGRNKILIFQNDGNLVLYNEGLHASWASNTWNKCTDTRYYSKELGLQQDGNFVVYCHENGAGAGHYTPLWSTNTWCRSPGSDYCKP